MTNIPAALTLAASTALADIPIAHIEKTYWDCDYAANRTIVDPSDAEFCGHAFERLKAEKFNGDFQKLLEWWKVNKAREHAVRAEKRSAN